MCSLVCINIILLCFFEITLFWRPQSGFGAFLKSKCMVLHRAQSHLPQIVPAAPHYNEATVGRFRNRHVRCTFPVCCGDTHSYPSFQSLYTSSWCRTAPTHILITFYGTHRDFQKNDSVVRLCKGNRQIRVKCETGSLRTPNVYNHHCMP